MAIRVVPEPELVLPERVHRMYLERYEGELARAGQPRFLGLSKHPHPGTFEEWVRRELIELEWRKFRARMG